MTVDYCILRIQLAQHGITGLVAKVACFTPKSYTHSGLRDTPDLRFDGPDHFYHRSDLF